MNVISNRNDVAGLLASCAAVFGAFLVTAATLLVAL